MWRQTRWIVLGASLALAAFVTLDVIAAIIVPSRYADQMHATSTADRLKAEGDSRSAILGLITPVVALIAGMAALLNFQETRRQNLESLALTRRGQVADRFTKAIEQLGESEKLDVRMGAIYALEQIAKDSQDLHWPVMQILTAYLREHSMDLPQSPARPEKKGMQNDVESRPSSVALHGPVPLNQLPTVRASADFLAIADVLRRRRWEWDAQPEHDPLYLDGCDLRAADLHLTHLRWARFIGAQLQWANFAGTHLQLANFARAQLQGAKFWEAQLERANLEAAQLQEADFWDAQLQGANLAGAQFKRTRFRETRLDGVDLTGARFEAVDLSQTTGLRQEQLDSAICDERTKPPPGLTINGEDAGGEHINPSDA